MIYTNKMRIFYTKIRFATKILKNQCCTTSTKGRDISPTDSTDRHGYAEHMNSPSRCARETIVRPKGDKKSKLSQLKTEVW